MLKDRRSQAILEYTLLLAAIIGIIVLVVFRSGGIKTTTQDVYDKSAESINTTAAQVSQWGVFGLINRTATGGMPPDGWPEDCSGYRGPDLTACCNVRNC